jgi:hypothetical protein
MPSMSKSESISVTGDDLSVVAGPSYMIQTEDGPGSCYDYFLVYHDRLPDALTFEESFSSEREAEEKRGEIEEFGGFDTQKWGRGDPWDHIHQGKSLEERYALRACLASGTRGALPVNPDLPSPMQDACIHTVKARLDTALALLRNLMPWIPDNLEPDEMPSEWKEAADFLKGMGR